MSKKLFLFLFLCALLAAGYWMGKKPSQQREFPVVENKPFALLVYASNDALWCKRALHSIFEQEYDSYRVVFVDDGSEDDTYEMAQAFVLENNQENRVLLLRNEEPLGPIASLYRAMTHLLDTEIAFPLFAKDWLISPSALSRLNAVYQNPDVWLATSPSIDYPSYEKNPIDSCCSFYAAIFREIRLSTFLQKGHFAKSRNSYLGPLIQLAKGHAHTLDDPLAFSNHSLARQEPSEEFSTSYAALTAFPHSQKNQRADLLLFSYDRPMQLYACLESVHRYIAGLESISVLYRASSDRFAIAYEQVKKNFPQVHFIRQVQKDFKPLLLKAAFHSPSEYILFGVDDLVVKDFVDLKLCMEVLEKTGAYGFYLRLGNQIRYCYQMKQLQALPESFYLEREIFAWDLKRAEHDWAFPNTLDMTLYRKRDIQKALESISFKNPNGLEFNWNTEHTPQEAIGLYFEHSKVVNIPLNIVRPTGNPHMNAYSSDELLAKFEEGLKIDIAPLHQVENPSPHFEYMPEFIAR